MPSPSYTCHALQQSNGDISLDPRNDTDIGLQIELNVDLQTALDVLVVETKALIGIFGLVAMSGAGLSSGFGSGVDFALDFDFVRFGELAGHARSSGLLK